MAEVNNVLSDHSSMVSMETFKYHLMVMLQVDSKRVTQQISFFSPPGTPLAKFFGGASVGTGRGDTLLPRDAF